MKKNEKELLKLKYQIAQKEFKCNTENSRFYPYAVILVVIFLTQDLSKFNWAWVWLILFSIIIFSTVKRITKLRKEIKQKYDDLFKVI